MNEREIHQLRTPCRNRSLNFQDNGDGSVAINGNRFETEKDCEEYLMQFPRTDIPAYEAQGLSGLQIIGALIRDAK